MEEPEEDNNSDTVPEGLPSSFNEFGTQEIDPMKEYWVSKLSNIEQQYDLQVAELERKLLSESANKRTKQKKILKLEEALQESTAELQNWKSKSEKLTGRLKEKEFEAKSLHDKLERADKASKNISKRMVDERQARRQYEKECNDLKNRLRILEKKKAQLLLDVEIKESEKARVEERETTLGEERYSFVRNLTEVDTERRIQTNANLKLCEDIEKLLKVEKSLETDLLNERKIMEEMMEEMKFQRHQHHDEVRKLEMTTKSKRATEEKLHQSYKKNEDLNRQIRHWKEEEQYKNVDMAAQNKEIRDLKRRNSRIRCILADTQHKLTACVSDMKSLEIEKRRADVELQSTKRQDSALQLEMRKNEIRKSKLEKFLKAHPLLMKRGRDGATRGSPTHEQPQLSAKGEVESYKKKIWRLERHKDEVERKLRELQRKENIYQLKLDKYSGIEKQIFWTGKAMAKLEGDRNRLETLLKTMESNMPMKVPFKKLVTDPSVLDRLAKNKILQKRIFQQAEKIEELKGNARRILQFREEQFSAMDQFPEEIPTWKLAYWHGKEARPESTFSGMEIDIVGQTRSTRKPFTKANYFEKYMEFLDDEIPKLKDEITFLEKKKLYKQAEKEAERKARAELVPQPFQLSGILADDDVEPPFDAKDDGGRVGEEEEDDDKQCTPDVSIHGSSFDGNEAQREALLPPPDKETRKMPSFQKQSAQSSGNFSSSEVEPAEDNDASSNAASEIPSDKSSQG